MSHVVIIGADRGIAAALVREYTSRGEQVTAVCRETGSSWLREGVHTIPDIDVTDDAAVKRMADRLEGVSIDTLVHVAGVGRFDRWPHFDFDAMLDHYNLNALGPLRVVSALHECFTSGAKVGIVTSRMASLGDNQSGGMYSYRMSKVAANMLGINLHHELRTREVSVVLLHPGTVATDMTKGAKNWDSFTRPEEAATGLARQLDDLARDAPPEFRHQDGTLLPW